MEDKNYGFYDISYIDTTDTSDYFPEINDELNNDSYKDKNNDTKVEPLVNSDNIFDSNCHDNFYLLEDFSTTFSSCLEKSSIDTISFLCESVEQDNSNIVVKSLPPDISINDPQCSTIRSNSFVKNRCELKKLLKVDVLSPVSLGSSYQSMNENLSIDSSLSNQTMSSLAHSTASYEFCAICNDLATGRHYGVSACEGCKGFFKRTIRKNLTYNCREKNACPITERLRNRCQSCRFKKCLDKGMKIEAVQKERILKKKLCPPDSKDNISIPPVTDEEILQNEMLYYCIDKKVCSHSPTLIEVKHSKMFCSIINKQLFNLVMWAKSVPGFSYLERSDQMILLNKSWVEILIASFSFRSSIEPEFGNIKLDDTHHLTLSISAELGLQNLVIRILRELIVSLKHLQVDQMEIACLKTIILFDSNISDYSNLKNPDIIKQFRFCIFDILKKYVSNKYPKQPSRIYKLLLKLPPIRGLTSCFVEKMKMILYDSLLLDDLEHFPLIDSDRTDIDNMSTPDELYPLLSEMMKQKDFPYL